MPSSFQFWLPIVAAVPLALLIVFLRGRRRLGRAHRFERQLASELLRQVSALDVLVGVLGGLADGLDGDRVLRRACEESLDLLDADVAVLFTTMADGQLRPTETAGIALDEVSAFAARDADEAGTMLADAICASASHAAPIAAHGELIGVLAVARSGAAAAPGPFTPAQLAQLRVIADFAGRAAQNARLAARLERLKTEAERRERERARLSNRLAETEHTERRRLSMLLHDGPQQTITSAALLIDACVDALADGEPDEAQRLLAIARRRNRDAVRDLRELGWSLEPPALREQGLSAALLMLAEKVGDAHGIRFQLDLAAAEALTGNQQTFVYQIVREAIANAVKHARPKRIVVEASVLGSDTCVICVGDDGPGMNLAAPGDGLSQGLDAMRERAAALGGDIAWQVSPLGGVEVRVLVPFEGLQVLDAAA